MIRLGLGKDNDGVSVDGNANVREVTPFNAEYRKYIRGKDGVEEAAQ